METQNTERTWTIDQAHTSVEFSVRHMMITSVKGVFEKVEGNVTGNPENLENAKARVSIQTGSVSTREDQRDGHLKSQDFFYSEKYPTMDFVTTRIKRKSGNEYTVTGNLTIRDVTKEMTLNGEMEGTIKDPYGNNRFGFSADGELNRDDFGLRWNTPLDNGGVMVGSKVKISIHLEVVEKKEK
ncbi:MAG: YceI family protein [Thermoplasmataceae archaeon]